MGNEGRLRGTWGHWLGGTGVTYLSHGCYNIASKVLEVAWNGCRNVACRNVLEVTRNGCYSAASSRASWKLLKWLLQRSIQSVFEVTGNGSENVASWTTLSELTFHDSCNLSVSWLLELDNDHFPPLKLLHLPRKTRSSHIRPYPRISCAPTSTFSRGKCDPTWHEVAANVTASTCKHVWKYPICKQRAVCSALWRSFPAVFGHTANARDPKVSNPLSCSSPLRASSIPNCFSLSAKAALLSRTDMAVRRNWISLLIISCMWRMVYPVSVECQEGILSDLVVVLHACMQCSLMNTLFEDICKVYSWLFFKTWWWKIVPKNWAAAMHNELESDFMLIVTATICLKFIWFCSVALLPTTSVSLVSRAASTFSSLLITTYVRVLLIGKSKMTTRWVRWW